MPRCSECAGERCGCVIQAGPNTTVTGAGTSRDPYVVSAAGAGGSAPPTGSMMMWPTATPPTGWLIANGSNVSRSSYAALFAVLGTAYGAGDGSTTFTLPNLAGRFPLGGNPSGSPAHPLAQTGGAETVQLTGAQNGPHTHTASSSSAGSHNHGGATEPDGLHFHTHLDKWSSGGTNPGAGTDGPGTFNDEQRLTNNAGLHSHTIPTDGAHTHPVTVDSSGQGQAHNNMPPFQVINFIIKT